MKTPTELHDLSVAELAAQLRQRKVSAVETARHFLARARANAELGAFLDFNEEATLAQASAADAALVAGTAGAALLGIPVAHKDIFVTRDFVATAGSKMLKGYRSPFDATVVARLAEQGAVTLGKLNCDEFAMGSANENSAFGPVKNPWDQTRVPGGSSGGSAAAVAARLVPAATGTDTGGLDPSASVLLRYHRHQADVWPCLALRHGGVCFEPGPGWTIGTQR